MSELQGGVLVFDLDDTLYLESDFAKSGFEAASAWLDREMGVANFAAHCQAIFATGRRSRVFDEALVAAGLAGERTLTVKLIEVYRQHHPRIQLAPDALEYLCNPARTARLALITDGHAATQMAKVKALGLEAIFDRIVYTDVWGSKFWKPHPRAFEAIQEWSGVPCTELVYIADNPAKDFIAPRRLGWRTIQIARLGRIHMEDASEPDHRADAVITSLVDLDACLATLRAGPQFTIPTNPE
ncbi:HAD superfamily hydrolase protein (plasmid) [Rhizobium etli 8C-3]|uniref:HAD superfamily hydrolase protein n=2 Tax=Rhizobium TaxID=379 RepID=A0A1L5PFY3_RHIET|nr:MULTISPECIES: HAD family hydrolase [Rhizobium]APO78940.1 HAD superfamily hydrolase protein [Rhizobium etli 8C-3]TCU28913.1 putative hydrolase of the HAD superfamily [Rhizobium azibense]TCU33828.1 putative hydrolase of the HAD superfamily [Rhizobium azibense]